MSHSAYTRAGRVAAYPFGLTPVLGTITSVITEKPEIGLTFDDGPDPTWTPVLLDILKKHGVKATFFVIGESFKKYPWVTERAAAEGHAICNHGWSHTSLPMLSPKEQLQEIRKCHAIIGEIGSNLFRPPYGHQTIRSRWSARVASHHVVTWSASLADWHEQSAEQLYHNLLGKLFPGAIILMHDAVLVSPNVTRCTDLELDRSALFEALDLVLKQSAGKFDFITLPDLIHRGRPRWENWYRFNPDVS